MVAKVVAPLLAGALFLTCGWDAGAKSAPRRPGPCDAVVPNVVGMEQFEAIDALAARGLDAYVWANKEGGLRWTVILSSPAAGTQVNRCVSPIVEIWVDQ